MNKKEQGNRRVAFSVTLGAALVTATTQVGPGFTTQSALFSAQLLGLV